MNQSRAQLVVDIATFANNPSRYNGKHIILRGVNISKNSTTSLSLSGPTTTPGTSPTGSPSSGGGISSGNAVPSIQNQPGTLSISSGTGSSSVSGTASSSSRVQGCTPPSNWEILHVDIPNYSSCYTIYNQMARTLPVGRTVNADITIQVNTRLMHRVVRVKLN